MQNTINHFYNRRGFIKKCLRIGAGSTVVIVSAVLGLRPSNNKKEDQDCTIQSPCRICTKFNGCELNRAAEYRSFATEA